MRGMEGNKDEVQRDRSSLQKAQVWKSNKRSPKIFQLIKIPAHSSFLTDIRLRSSAIDVMHLHGELSCRLLTGAVMPVVTFNVTTLHPIITNLASEFDPINSFLFVQQWTMRVAATTLTSAIQMV